MNKPGWDKALLIAMTALSVLIVVSSVAVILWTYNVIPIQDHWTAVDAYRLWREGRLDLKYLWSQHNEHRILFPRIFYVLDYAVAGGTQWLLLPLMLLLQGAHAAVLAKAYSRENNVSRSDHVFFAGVAFSMLFWLIQSGNLSWGFQIPWALNGLFVSLAAWLVCGLEKETPRATLWKTLGLTALCCVVATYSLANGIFMAGILLAWMWKIGLPRGAALAWLLFCLALGASYMAGYHSPAEQTSPLTGLRFRTLHHVVVYLGNPVSRLYQPAGALLGILGLGLFAFFVRRVLTEKHPAFYLRFGVAHLAYVVVTAVITALGRGDVGIEQASSSRYFTTGLIFWFIQLSLVYAAIGGSSRFARPFRAALLGAFVLFLVPVQIGSVPHREREHRRYDDGALAFMTGVDDSVPMAYLYQFYATDPLMARRNEFLREHRLTVYRDPWTRTLGKELNGVYRVDSSALATGEANVLRELIVPGREGFYVEGRVGEADGKIPEVVLFARAGKIAGYAKTAHRPCRGCFSGYVRGKDRDFGMFALNKGSAKIHRIAPRR